MALDGIVVRSLVRELQSFVGGRINKIHQPSPHDIVLQIRAQGGNHKWLLSANPTYPRTHVTQRQFLNPTEAPMFCMLFRKHFEGSVIEDVRQVGLERIIHIDARQFDELGDVNRKRIVIELMGRHSNVILLDPQTNVILDGIHHVTPSISSYRVIMPGSAYMSPPEQAKRSLVDCEPSDVRAIAAEAAMAAGDKPLHARLLDLLEGVSPLLARELAFRAGNGADADRLCEVLDDFRDQLKNDRYAPRIVEQPNGKTVFSVVELTHLEGESTAFDTVSACLEAYFGDKAMRDAVKQKAQDLIRFLQNELNKNEKKLDKLRDTMEEARDADRFRVLGELLTAHLHQFGKGDASVEVTDFYDERQARVSIELDPLLTPSENAQRYFKRYAKSKKSLIAVGEQLEATEREIRYLEELLQQVQNAGLHDIEGIREELEEQGYVRRKQKTGKKAKKPDKPPLTCYTSSEGIPIYVGKNNLQNEYLTNRLAAPNDTWLHTKDIPGSHVVIRAESFGDATLEEAAMLAAYYSKAKESSQVPVDYTLIRHVRKPNGAKPGFVIYERQKTLYITPDAERIARLPQSVK